MTDRDPLLERLARTCAGEVVGGAELAALTTLRVGGPARVLVRAAADADLAAVGAACREHRVPWLVIGRGSNLLVGDRGWPGVAVVLGAPYRGVEVTHVAPGVPGHADAPRTGGADAALVRAGAAEPLPALAVRLARQGLAGFAWAVAVPGTVGGAVRMNAGAHGREIADVLVQADVVRLSSGARETWPVAALELGYRRSGLPDDAVVVVATLRLERGAPRELAAELAGIRRWRRAHQPVHVPNCGSVFANPVGDAAGRLLDTAGGKGLRVGGARVSEQHANFIVTEPGATAADVRTLIRRLSDLVEEAHGVRLRPEVVMRGDFGEDGG